MAVRAVIVGGGHNGLAAAAYLARAGVRVLLLERREVLGGACVTEELWPGFLVSRAAYVVGLLRPALVRELDLARHGLRLIPRDPASYTPLPDRRGLFLGPDLARSCAEIRRFSPRDAERYPAYEALLDGIARAVEPLLDAAPPDLARPTLSDARTLASLARRLFSIRRELPAALSLVLSPARRSLERWFESEPLRGTLATDAVIGAWASPSSPGTGAVLVHHVMGETHGARGVWAYVAGGMGRLAMPSRRRRERRGRSSARTLVSRGSSSRAAEHAGSRWRAAKRCARISSSPAPIRATRSRSSSARTRCPTSLPPRCEGSTSARPS
ncbi:MAG TPA: NAD(P)/FAD-dependent oxidoreductase [Myxococcota bacterium]|nr:NAD(P)/FAD-dependent oxidoreductase [Myxococcota bacterium]